MDFLNMRFLFPFSAFLSLLLSGGIFGFFYAWVCSTMWGLDALPPNTAIAAMQAMNASVRNAVFAPAFFGTPFVMLLTGLLAFRLRETRSAVWFSLGGLLYLFGGMMLTMMVNVPMNEALAQISLPLPEADAIAVWTNYSGPWQFWNIARALVSGVALLCAGLGLWSMHRNPATS